MDEHNNHAELVSGFYNEQKEIFANSRQGMYAFLDDDGRVCNEKFATLLGYASAEEWANVDVQGAFPDAFVADNSQRALVEAYQNAMEKLEASTFTVEWKRKSGGTVKTTVTLVPVMYQNHLFALHYISEYSPDALSA